MTVFRSLPRARLSLPARGVWIEIENNGKLSVYLTKSLPARGVWIEIPLFYFTTYLFPSLPARGVWIEIAKISAMATVLVGSLPARGVWIEIPRSRH